MTPVVIDSSVDWIADHWESGPVAASDREVFGFLEIPFDYAVSHRPGARFGPRAILDELDGYSLYCADKRTSLATESIARLGAVEIVHSFEESYRRIRESTAKIPPHYTPVFLGGDHSIADPIIRGLQDRDERKFGIIVFDAHLDSRPPIEGKEHSGHWMHTLSDAIDYSCVAQLGISACIYSERYVRDAEESGIYIRTPYELRRDGWDRSLSAAIEHVTRNADSIYLSVDIDVLDQSFAPGTSVPNPTGLYPYEVMDAVFEIASAVPTVGLDINEVSPPLDRDNRTSSVAAQICMNYMAGVTRRRRAIQGRTAALGVDSI